VLAGKVAENERSPTADPAASRSLRVGAEAVDGRRVLAPRKPDKRDRAREIAERLVHDEHRQRVVRRIAPRRTTDSFD
jgi:hypothetical protein